MRDDRRERYWSILKLGTPIVGGMISQNVLNLVDTAMVGTLGNAALAGVGTGSFLNFMSGAFLTGFSAGVQAMVARRIGQQRESVAAVPLNGGLLTVALMGVPWAILLFLLAPMLFPLVNDSAEVVAVGVPYWQARLAGLVAIGLNFSFRGFWNGIKRPGFYLRTLLVMHATNLALNYVLIFGKFGFPAYGATGAGIASAISVYVGLATYVFLALRHARGMGFLRGLPDRETLKTMLSLSVPSGIQQFLFAASYTVLFAILGMVGTTATAAANVIINVTLVALLPGIAFGIAAATLVGQALGRSDPDDAHRSAWDVVTVAGVVMTSIGLPMIFMPDLLLSVFIHEPETIEVARLPLRIVGLTIGGDAVGMVLMNALMGAGATRTTMAVQVTLQWGLLLPAAYIVGPVLGYGLLGVWTMQAVVRVVQATIYIVIWQRRAWSTIRV